MKIADMNWMQVEAYLRGDDRCVLPIGSTEQHAQLSLALIAILAERVAVEAAEPLGVPGLSGDALRPDSVFFRLPGHRVSACRNSARRHARCDRLRAPCRVPPRPDRQRPWRKCARGCVRPGADGQVYRDVGQVPQLVECAEDMGQGSGHRHIRIARQLDGELSLGRGWRTSRSRRPQRRRPTGSSCASHRPKTRGASSATAASAATTRSRTR